MGRVSDTTTIASKISRTDKLKLHTIAADLGISFYALIQSIMLTIIRYCDKGGNVSAEHSILIDAFGLVLKSTIDSHIPISARNSEKDNIKSAILFVERGRDKRPQMMEVSKDGYGNMTESYNYDTMLSSFLNAIDPDILKVLKDKSKELGYFSLIATLRTIVMQSRGNQYSLDSEIEEMFSDIRITSGQAINEDTRYKKKHRRNVSDYTTIEQHQTFRADL